MPGLTTRLAVVAVCTLSLMVVVHAEGPANTQQLDDLNRDSQSRLHAIQQRSDPPIPASQAMQQRQQQSRLQSSQRNELLRRHYRSNMLGRSPGQVRHEGIARQRRFQLAQEAQLQRFDRMSRGSAAFRSTSPGRRSAPDPLAPLRR